MEAMDSYLREVDQWRKMPSIDSRETHLPFLEGLIDPHIEFIRQGILQQNTGAARRQLEVLEMFIEEAHERRASGRVSYRWWVNFNYRLSILISARKSVQGPNLHHENKWISDNDLEEYYINSNNIYPLSFNPSGLNCFPEVALCPVKNGTLGYFTFNRVHTTRAYPLGLTNKRTPVDGLSRSPQEFFEHDRVHFTSSDQVLDFLKEKNILEKRIIPFHRAFLQKMDTLPLSERKNAEWVYFLLSHEYIFMFWANKRQISTKEALMKVRLYESESEKNILNFMDIVHEIERDLGW